MAQTVCKSCRVANPPDAMFCHECGGYMVATDKQEIERKIEQSHCNRCGHYNSVEATDCDSCGYSLVKKKSAVFRDENGRLRLLREPPVAAPARALCTLVIASCLFVCGRIFYFVFQGAGEDFARAAQNPLGGTCVAYLTVCFLVLLQRQTRLDYKAKAVFGLGVGLMYAFYFAFGSQVAIWEQTSLREGLLWTHVAGMIYCLFFYLRAEFLSSWFSSAFFVLGLYCLYPALSAAFGESTYALFLDGSYRVGRRAAFLTPGFLCFNVFLPHTFLMMFARLGHQFGETSRFVAKNATDKAVLRQFRIRQLRGVFLDLFVAAVITTAGLWLLYDARKLTILGPLVKLYARVVG